MYVYIHVAALETAEPIVFVVWLLAWVDVGLVKSFSIMLAFPPP